MRDLDRNATPSPSEPVEPRPLGCGAAGCCRPLDRRGFLKLAGLGAAAGSMAPWAAVAGPFEAKDVIDHFVPADKKLRPEWVQALFQRGTRQWYSGSDLKMIAMPIGGITTGQLYLNGEGRLVHWDIFNQHNFSGYGDKNYFAGPPQSPIQQGFAVRVTAKGKTWLRTLARQEGIFLDPIYTGKAFAGLLEMAERGELGANDPIIFLHTGGAPALFAHAEEFVEK